LRSGFIRRFLCVRVSGCDKLANSNRHDEFISIYRQPGDPHLSLSTSVVYVFPFFFCDTREKGLSRRNVTFSGDGREGMKTVRNWLSGRGRYFIRRERRREVGRGLGLGGIDERCMKRNIDPMTLHSHTHTHTTLE
jgi:hypothetical protein